jgi:hypothetical protein
MVIKTKRVARWCVGFVKALNGGGGPGVKPRGLHIIFINHILNQQPTDGFHVAAFHWATWHHAICPKSATWRIRIRPLSTNQILPCHHCQFSCHMFHVICTAATSSVRHMPRQLYGLPSQHPFFPVWQFEQIAITFAPDVRLRRNELRWVRNDEGYKPICFEAILRTLIFEVKFDPWSRF